MKNKTNSTPAQKAEISIDVSHNYWGNITFMKKIVHKSLLYLPDSWKKQINNITLATPNDREAYNEPNTIQAICQRIFRKDNTVEYCHLVFFEPMYKYSFVNFVKLLIHEASHANDWDIIKWSRRQKSQLRKLFKHKKSYRNHYLQRLDDNDELTISEYWAEIVATAIINPKKFRRKYPQEYSFVEGFIPQSDPHFCMICNRQKLFFQQKKLKIKYALWYRKQRKESDCDERNITEYTCTHKNFSKK